MDRADYLRSRMRTGSSRQVNAVAVPTQSHLQQVGASSLAQPQVVPQIGNTGRESSTYQPTTEITAQLQQQLQAAQHTQADLKPAQKHVYKKVPQQVSQRAMPVLDLRQAVASPALQAKVTENAEQSAILHSANNVQEARVSSPVSSTQPVAHSWATTTNGGERVHIARAVVAPQVATADQATEQQLETPDQLHVNDNQHSTFENVLGYSEADSDFASDQIQLKSTRSKRRGKRALKAVAFMVSGVVMFAGGVGISFLQGRPGTSGVSASQEQQVLGDQTEVPSASTGGTSSEISLGVSGASGINGSLQPSSTSSAPSEGNGYTRTTDTYKSIPLVIVRQPLPDSMRNDPTSLAAVAKELRADRTISSPKWGTVYIATDSANNAQVAVMADSNQLIAIQSSGSLQDADWSAYADRL